MNSVSVIIPTFNRYEELIATLPQIATYIDEQSELIIFDQSTEYDPRQKISEIKTALGSVNFKFFHCKVPSVPLAWNTAASHAEKEILLFLDDDINVDFNVLDAHKKKYIEKPNIVGVAGGYYASSRDRIWVPSSRKGNATALAGVNVSIRADVFKKSGAASSFKKPFAGFDWELAEHISFKHGKLAVGDDILVFHRAPANGGCGNQSVRDQNWYYGAYHNHFLWMLSRKLPLFITRLPRHFYWISRYCVPKRATFMSKGFFKNAVVRGFIDAIKTYQSDQFTRSSRKARDDEYSLVCSNSTSDRAARSNY